MTNKSEHIDPDLCRSCGKCCETFSLPYPKSLATDNPLVFSEVKRFRDLNTNIITVSEEGDYMLVTINVKCRHLIEKAGRYRCRIYGSERRPELCKQYPFKDTIDCPEKR